MGLFSDIRFAAADTSESDFAQLSRRPAPEIWQAMPTPMEQATAATTSSRWRP